MEDRTLDQNFVCRIPHGDNRERQQCNHCGYIAYENPKIVAGVVATWEGKYLLAKRAIEPRKGFWTIPAGYLELNEAVVDGAVREAWEETRAHLTVDQVLAIYSVPHLSQTQVFYRAKLNTPEIGVGEESSAVTLAAWADIPWEDMAFPTAVWALKHHRLVEGQTVFAPFSNPQDPLGDIA